MKNYIIINGVSSLTKTGLMINELPPISKAEMRVNQEEIDGRDGDIITKLGYAAYDKEVSFGLFGSGYNVDDIISFFNQEGTITFSNEPDKVYNFTVIDMFDIERLLKFKTGVITFHIQPFKYPLTETPVEAEYEYVEAEGENLSLNTTDAVMEIDLKGNTSQVQYSGKNLFDKSNVTDGYRLGTNGGGASDENYYISSYIKVDANTQYTKNSPTADAYHRFAFYTSADASTFISVSSDNTITTPSTCNYIRFCGLKTEKDTTMLVKGATLGEYEPYCGGTPSPNPSYPQDIHSVSGDNEIEVFNKNWFKSTLFQDYTSSTGIKISHNDKGEVVLNGTPSVQADINSPQTDAVLLPSYATQFKLSGATENVTIAITYLDKDKQYISATRDSGNSPTSSVPNNAVYYTMNIRITAGTVLNNYVVRELFELGSTPTTYEPYTGATYPINLPSGIELNKIGTYQDKFIRNSGKNLWGGFASSFSRTNNDVDFVSNIDGTISVNGTASANATSMNSSQASSNNFLKTLSAGTYNISGATNEVELDIVKSDGTLIAYTTSNTSFTLESETIIFVRVSVANGTSVNNKVIYPMLVEGTATEYEPYGSGEWYLKKEIGKYVANNDLTGNGTQTSRIDLVTPILDIDANLNIAQLEDICYCNMLGYDNTTNSYLGGTTGTKKIRVFLSTDYASDYATANTFLKNNNFTIDYVLQTPTYTEITDETLISQLDAVSSALSYKPQTNITQINDDLPFILSVKAMTSNSVVITNSGNIYSKPIFRLVGTGNVNLYINGSEVLQIDLSSHNDMTIDTNLMEAWDTNTNVLTNRQVIGDYSKIKFNVGDNELSFTGDLTEITITKYKRWL